MRLGKGVAREDTFGVRSPACRLLPVVLLCLAASPLFGQADPDSPKPNFRSSGYIQRPIGVLGMPLGSFAVIEGTVRETNMLVGSDDFVVASVNGIKPPHPVTIQLAASSARICELKPGSRYVLHGWEAGKWEGQPDGLPSDAADGNTQTRSFGFHHTFEVSSLESTNGVISPKARPVDPNGALPKPDFSTSPDKTRPVGLLGLPLGTFVEIKAHLSDTDMFGGNFTVDSVSGVAAPKGSYIAIADVKSKLGGVVSLHGYEAGEWGSTPSLPQSENPGMGEAQQPFQCYHNFQVIQCR